MPSFWEAITYGVVGFFVGWVVIYNLTHGFNHEVVKMWDDVKHIMRKTERGFFDNFLTHKHSRGSLLWQIGVMRMIAVADTSAWLKHIHENLCYYSGDEREPWYGPLTSLVESKWHETWRSELGEAPPSVLTVQDMEAVLRPLTGSPVALHTEVCREALSRLAKSSLPFENRFAAVQKIGENDHSGVLLSWALEAAKTPTDLKSLLQVSGGLNRDPIYSKWVELENDPQELENLMRMIPSFRGEAFAKAVTKLREGRKYRDG